MLPRFTKAICASLLAATSLASLPALAQQTGQPAPAPAAQPKPFDPNEGLPQSSRPSTDTSRSSDGFDLMPKSGGSTFTGNKDATGYIEPSASRVPGSHVVRKGDTLWDITGQYYRNPWMWPRIWSYNPNIQNPHWIYPGDHVKLRNDGGDGRPTQTLGGLVNRRSAVPRDTIFLRDQGFIDDPRRDVWGEVSGSPEDQLLLSEGNNIYLELKGDHEAKQNQDLTIFKPVRDVKGGAVVQVLGTARIEQYDSDKKIARAKIIESIDVIERGAQVGIVGRKFDVVPPARNNNELSAKILYAVYPRVYHARNQVVFIDKGSEDGLKIGNRLFVLRRGDPWRATLSGSGDMSSKNVRDTEELAVETDDVSGSRRDNDYPDEVVGELRVLRVREHTATCMVTVSRVELVAGDLAVARKGY